MGSVSRNVMVANVHGLWLSQGKKDTPERIEQSEKITAFLRRHSGPAILCGDLNLLLDTRSIQILEEAGMRNLIREHAIPSTRTKHYASGKGDFADYVFVSSEIRVRNFQALDEEVSDHLPLLLDFD